MPFSPSDLTNLKIWLKADAGAGSSNNDPVGTWTDQSGQSHNFTQATSGKKPLYQTNKRNGLPAVVFDGSDDQLDGGDLSAVFTNAATVMVAVNNIPGGAGKMMVWESKNNDPWWVFTGNAGYWGLFRATRLANTPSSGLSPSGWSIWALTADNGSNYKVWTDNVLKINDTGGFTFDGGNEHILGYQKTNNEYKQMEVGEIVATSDVLGSTDFNNLYDYMNGRWGTAVNATASPSTTVGTGAVPAPTAQGNGTGLPSATAGIGAVPIPTAFGNTSGVPVTTAGVGAVPAPTATGGTGATASGQKVTGTGAVPAPTVIGGFGASAMPSQVAGVGLVPHPHAVGQGTGGGGGTSDGVTDFWTIKALG
jgi:hypothetical protein